ncbi:MAG: DNA replication/repair protein RecF [Firmicutes bacterium]|nr:DNA replication/repair protein RecF [Bacillota bacterium]
MYFKSVELNNFRNYKDQKVEFDPDLNIILGDNAQGKTNLLESLFIMGLGRSFKTTNDKEMIAFGEDFSRASSVVIGDDKETQIDIVYNQEGKIIKVDGIKLQRSVDLLENVYVVVFSPEDLRIVKDGPEHRRRFLDRELCQIKPMYYSDLGNYKKILKQRNSYLKEDAIDRELFEVFDESLINYGIRIVEERKRFTERLYGICGKIHSDISNGREKLAIRYETEIKDKDSFRQLLKGSFETDRIKGYTSCGPHKDYLGIFINGKDIRIYGSQGQQRTASLSMKLAEVELIKNETGQNPVLLLDDVFSELDAGRQKYLIESMKGVQIFVTATGIEEGLMDIMPDGNVYYVDNGKINLYNKQVNA